jgi:hypothetical protein
VAGADAVRKAISWLVELRVVDDDVDDVTDDAATGTMSRLCMYASVFDENKGQVEQTAGRKRSTHRKKHTV